MVTATRFQRWHAAGFTAELLPIIPPGAKITDGSKVRAEHLGKVPGVKTPSGSWSGLGGRWPDELRPELADVKKWHAWAAGVGIQGRKFPGLDIDVSDAALAGRVSALANEYLGAGPVRGRTGSARRLHVFRTDEQLRKVRLAFRPVGAAADSKPEAVELLAYGQQWVAEGKHPAGGEYEFRGEHPCDCKPAGLPTITAADVERFFDVLRELLEAAGCTVAQAPGSATMTAGARKGLDDPALWAPSPEDVLEALDDWQPESLPHDEFVAVMAAIKAALGPDREEHYPAVFEWAPGARSSEDEATRKVWDSIADASVGWDWLASKARAGHVAAQAEFAEAPAGDGMDAADPGETARAAMVSRFVYCVALDRYVDLPTGDLLTDKAFNSMNVSVARFGKTGVDSAAATFQNRGDSRKVTTATYRPGAPHIVREEVNGSIRDAVNMYRPALLKPAPGDVGPWLEHITLLFGEEGEATREHVLNYMAFIVQNPGVKINHAPVFLGEEGVGKDTALEPLRRALGAHNCATIGPEELTAPFNSGWIERQFLIINEAHTFHRRETMNKLKPLIAAPPDTLQVNRKNVAQYHIPNIINVVMFTNHEDALAPTQGDRRYWVHRCLIDEKPSKAYFVRLWGWFNAGGDAAVFAWLMARDVSAFDPKEPAPMTEAKQDMIAASSPAAVRWLEEQFEDEGAFRARELLTVREIITHAHTGFDVPAKAAESIRESYVLAELKKRGFNALPGKLKVDGKTGRVWARGGAKETEARFVLHRLEQDRKKTAA